VTRGSACPSRRCGSGEQLCILRDYLIFHSKVRIPYDDLTNAIDDYVEKLTGDRTKLHAPHHSIGK
jgi:hypothetical protein